MRIYIWQQQTGLIFQDESGDFKYSPTLSLNEVFAAEDPFSVVAESFKSAKEIDEADRESGLVPIGDQEVWAAGVTYFRSRSARMEEAESAGGDVFYDKVYEAPRPELFFKATSSRVRGDGEKVCIRSDSTWDVPEPELTLAVNRHGKLFGYTIGNDMSSRSIEGENPLYLPQAKVYKGACALGPGLLVTDEPISKQTQISITIDRKGKQVFTGETQVGQIKRDLQELVDYLFHSNEFTNGVYLMTGTGIVPDADFTLQVDDVVQITIDGLGTLTNTVELT